MFFPGITERMAVASIFTKGMMINTENHRDQPIACNLREARGTRRNGSNRKKEED